VTILAALLRSRLATRMTLVTEVTSPDPHRRDRFSGQKRMGCEHCHNYDSDNCPACRVHRQFHDTPEELRAHRARYIENQKHGLLSAKQLADQVKVNVAVIKRHAWAGAIRCQWIDGEAFFNPYHIKRALRRLGLEVCPHDDLDFFGRCRDCRRYNMYNDPMRQSGAAS